MKITWFGGITFRIYVGGKIFVTDHDRAPGGIDPHEVSAAADFKIDLSDGINDFPFLDLESWKKQRPRRLLDMPEETVAALYTIEGEALFIDEPQEGPVIVAPGGQTAWGHFADNAIVVLYGEAQAILEGAQSLLIAARPKLIVIAADGFNDEQLSALSDACGGCAMQVLEQGFAIEA